MRLIIAEKPSVARDIAKVLGATTRGSNCLTGNGWRVTWAFGHLVGLASPSGHHPSWSTWDLKHLPMLPECFELEPLDSGRDQLEAIRGWLTDGEHEDVINACDAGREGELIFGYIYEWCQATLPIKRLWISSMTPQAIEQGFASLADGRSYRPLLEAAKARSQADWLVGMNGTRLMTLAARRAYPHADVPTLSVGRVQTPTLALVVERAKAHEAFTPSTFYTVEVTFQTPSGSRYTGVMVHPSQDEGVGERMRFDSKEEVAHLCALLERCTHGHVARLEAREQKTAAPKLFDLTTLQRDANTRLGLSAARTLQVCQALYEKHKLLTYPRTDSRHVTPDLADTFAGLISGLTTHPEFGSHAAALALPETYPKAVVDASKVTDHHAILPTSACQEPGLPERLEDLEADELAIYNMVCTRLLAALSPPERYETTTLVTRIGDEALCVTRGKRVIAQGWRAIESPPKDDERDGEAVAKIPADLEERDQVSLDGVRHKEGVTRAPKLLTEATLLRAMETAGRSLDDAEFAEAMKSTGGLGTPATRASTIEGLLSRKLIVRQKKNLVPTALGKTLIQALGAFGALTSAELTGKWEHALERIATANYDAASYMTQIEKFVQQLVAHYISKPPSLALPERESLGTCPSCGGAVRSKEHIVWCSNYANTSCDVVFSRRVAGLELTDAHVRALLEDGKTPLIQGFRSKSGKTFAARLALIERPPPEPSSPGVVSLQAAKEAKRKQSGWKLEFVFDPPEPIATCPACERESVMRRGKRIECGEEGCSFALWVEVAGKLLTDKQLGTLLSKKKTGTIAGFKSRENKPFEAALVLEPPSKSQADKEQKWRVSFDFSSKGAKKKGRKKGKRGGRS